MELTDATLKSEQLLEEIKRHNRSKDIVDVEEERTKVVIVTVGGDRYAFYGEDIREILPACEISWVPGLPDYLPGLIVVRGDIESVVDIRHFLGAGRAAGETGLIALAVRGDFRSGIIIDSVEDVVDVPHSAIKPPLSTLNGAARDLLTGEIDRDGTVIPLLDIGKMAARVTL
jgi:purine-binding chemotaxis protein CheW